MKKKVWGEPQLVKYSYENIDFGNNEKTESASS